MPPELVARFELAGVPPNLLNVRMHWARLAQTKKLWFEAAAQAGQLARKGRAKATASDFRQVRIELHRVRFLDKDGAEASVKAIVDALKRFQRRKVGGVMLQVEGVGLIYDDGAEYCRWSVVQIKTAHFADQKTVIEISSTLTATISSL